MGTWVLACGLSENQSATRVKLIPAAVAICVTGSSRTPHSVFATLCAPVPPLSTSLHDPGFVNSTTVSRISEVVAVGRIYGLSGRIWHWISALLGQVPGHLRVGNRHLTPFEWSIKRPERGKRARSRWLGGQALPQCMAAQLRLDPLGLTF